MKKVKYILVLVGVLFITGCSKSNIKEISYNEYKNLIDNKETFILEVMREDCINCKNFKPKLNEVAKKYIINVKSISTDNLSDEEVVKLEIETGNPICYELDENLLPIKHYYLKEEK